MRTGRSEASAFADAESATAESPDSETSALAAAVFDVRFQTDPSRYWIDIRTPAGHRVHDADLTIAIAGPTSCS
jgi:hypothetical protein